jgi:hypothetical protein
MTPFSVLCSCLIALKYIDQSILLKINTPQFNPPTAPRYNASNSLSAFYDLVCFSMIYLSNNLKNFCFL